MYRPLDQNYESNDNSEHSLIEGISIPYCTRLPQKLSVGAYIEIFGKIDENANHFAVNLLTDSDDIAFHLNARFAEDSVVRNSRIDNQWCNEEREPLIMPFEKNKSFTLIISVGQDAFRLFVNGVHFVDFGHRLPFKNVTSIGIEGELQVLWIKCDRMDSDHNWDAFSLKLSSSSSPAQQPHEMQTFYEPKLPFIEEITGGLRVGMVLSIIGRPLSNDGKFDINLVQKKDSVPIPNIALHMSVRFAKKIEDSLIVRNYRFDGKWGTEDRYGTEFPFSPQKIFDLRIIVENNRFIVIINGKNFTEFPIRLFPLSDTNQIEIIGNLRLLSVRF